MSGQADMLSAALGWAAMGYPVFPCSPSQKKGVSKRPLTPKASAPGVKDGGLYVATTDEAQITAWWRRFPKALIGMPTGRASGVLVLDLDPKQHDADSMLRAVAVFCGGSLPPAPVVRTQSGGLHVWFAYDEAAEDIGNRGGLFRRVDGCDEVIRDHVDVRGEGGYVIVPPSVMEDGASYDWEQSASETDPPPLPARLADAILRRGEFDPRGTTRPAARPAPSGTAPDPTADGAVHEALRKYGLTALDRECRELAGMAPGARGHELNRAGFQLGQLVGAGVLDHAMAAAGLRSACDSNGLTVTDGARLVDSNIDRSLKDGARDPRDLTDVRRQAERRISATARRNGPPPPTPHSGDGTIIPKSEMHQSGDRHGDHSFSEGAPFGGDEPPPVDWDMLRLCAREPDTDIGNGRRFLHRYRHEVFSIARLGAQHNTYGWHVYDGKRWREDVEGASVRPLAHDAVEKIAIEPWVIEPTELEQAAMDDAQDAVAVLNELAQKQVLEPPEKAERERLKKLVAAGEKATGALADRKAKRRRFAKSSGGSTKVDGMLKEAACYVKATIDQFDIDPLTVNVNNCTLRFADCGEPDTPAWDIERLEHCRDDRITKLIGVDYDPDAECPLFLNFLERVQPIEVRRDFLRRFYGYCLTALTKEQAFLFNYGEGSNGKSTMIDVIAKVMGDYATSLPFQRLVGDDKQKGSEATPDLARLPGARMVRVSEAKEKTNLDEAMVKSMTSSEPVLVRRLFGDFNEIYPSFKLVLSGNHKPKISGTDDGIWRRMLLMPWEVQIPDEEKDKELENKLWAERSGILNWLVQGVLEYLQGGLQPPDAVIEAVKEYREESDPIGGFIKDGCTLTGNPDDTTKTADLYEAFCAHCKRNGVFPLGVNTFNRNLPRMANRHGFEKAKSAGRTIYRGIVINAGLASQVGSSASADYPDYYDD